jgi:hypothetical protein
MTTTEHGNTHTPTTTAAFRDRLGATLDERPTGWLIEAVGAAGMADWPIPNSAGLDEADARAAADAVFAVQGWRRLGSWGATSTGRSHVMVESA